MNWAIVIPVGIGIAVLLSIALIAIDVSGQISRKEEADEVEFYFAKEFAQTTPSSHIPPYQDVSKIDHSGYQFVIKRMVPTLNIDVDIKEEK